jgi:hypothetical protein
MLGLGREARALCELLPRGLPTGIRGEPSWLNKDKIAFTDIPEEYICRKGSLFNGGRQNR